MISVTRVNGEILLLNSDLIEHIEAAHDTVVTLINGQRYVVQESPEELVARVVAFRRSILEEAGGLARGGHRAAAEPRGTVVGMRTLSAAGSPTGNGGPDVEL